MILTQVNFNSLIEQSCTLHNLLMVLYSLLTPTVFYFVIYLLAVVTLGCLFYFVKYLLAVVALGCLFYFVISVPSGHCRSRLPILFCYLLFAFPRTL